MSTTPTDYTPTPLDGPPVSPPENGTPVYVLQSPTGRLPELKVTAGHYVVLWAEVPADPDARPLYQEATYVAANDEAHAKRQAMRLDQEAGGKIIAEFLRAQALDLPRGIYLRAVPARSWAPDVEPTSFVAAAPELKIG